MAELPDTDVLVVGAGIGGLSVADRLAAAGLGVTVLEARTRPGGRLLSAAPGLDLGATWFWPGETRVATLVERFGIPTFDQHGDGDAMYEDPTGMRRLDGNPLDSGARRFVGGSARLADRLAATLPAGCLHYGCVVDGVERGDTESLEVIAGGTRWRCRHVVLAVPPSLAMATIGLPDDLPIDLRRVAAATPVWMGHIAKVVAVYADPFWRAAGLAGSAFSRIGPLQEIHDMSGVQGHPAALFGFAPAASLGEQSEDQILEQLARLFGPAAAQPQQLVIQDWSAERFTTPSAPESGIRADYSHYGSAFYQRPALNGRLHWSSTETGPGHPGHIEGALEAAERTARWILAENTRW